MAEDLAESRARISAAPHRRISPRLANGRKLFITVHRTIGLFLGAIYVLIGISGSILAFGQSIDEALNASIMRVEAPGVAAAYRPLDEILAAAKAAAPPGSMPERLKMPRHAGLAVAITILVPTDDLDMDSIELFVDPYKAEITGQRLLLHQDDVFAQPFINIVRDFHWTLLLGPQRAYLLGIVAILMSFSLLIGVYLWWPRNGNWRHALTIKWNATPERLTYDVHKTLGLYLGFLLIVSLATGIAMIYKPQTRAIVGQFSVLRPEAQNQRSTAIAGQRPLGLDAAAAIADKVFPDGRLHWVLLPGGSEGVYVIGKQAEDEPNQASTNRNVTIDQFSGNILHVQDRRNFTAGETFLEWLYPLHCGEAFGNIGRALVLMIGIVPLLLYVTGFLRWRQKRRLSRCGRP
ncbi:MAG TPA: PepSY-associated TM helix domain-containing protein [Methylocella sp.]|nr:PepSY-associated TM helix domain-containing protein [Methylocella sp.]